VKKKGGGTNSCANIPGEKKIWTDPRHFLHRFKRGKWVDLLKKIGVVPKGFAEHKRPKPERKKPGGGRKQGYRALGTCNRCGSEGGWWRKKEAEEASKSKKRL